MTTGGRAEQLKWPRRSSQVFSQPKRYAVWQWGPSSKLYRSDNRGWWHSGHNDMETALAAAKKAWESSPQVYTIEALNDTVYDVVTALGIPPKDADKWPKLYSDDAVRRILREWDISNKEAKEILERADKETKERKDKRVEEIFKGAIAKTARPARPLLPSAAFFANKEFVFTGALSITRAEAQRIVALLGGKFGGTVKRTTYYLVQGDKAGSKTITALRFNVKVLSEAEFWSQVRDAAIELGLENTISIPIAFVNKGERGKVTFQSPPDKPASPIPPPITNTPVQSPSQSPSQTPRKEGDIRVIRKRAIELD